MKLLIQAIFFFIALTLLAYPQDQVENQNRVEEGSPPIDQYSTSTSSNSNSEWGHRLVNRSEFLTYYRGSYVVEITGNEQTFGVALHPDLDYLLNYKESVFKFTMDFYLLEALSTRGRFADNFDPPTWYPNDLSLSINFFKYHTVQGGIMKPILHVSPQQTYYLPIVFRTGNHTRTSGGTNQPGYNYPASNYINHALMTGHRDYPITYLITPHYDTGISWKFWISAFEMLLAYSNGEMGLDSNSAKSVSGRFAYRDEIIFAGLGFHVGNLGSVPIKEYNHQIKAFFYYRFPYVTLGVEALLRLHGIRDLDVLSRAVVGEFEYGDGFFDPFTVYYDQSYDTGGQIYEEMLYGLAAHIYLEIAYRNFFSVIHGSYYDPNLLSEESLMYRRRYRAFLSLGYQLTYFFKIITSFTYGYDQYYSTTSQFYDSTEPRQIHPIHDMDFYFGFVFNIYPIEKTF